MPHLNQIASQLAPVQSYPVMQKSKKSLKEIYQQDLEAKDNHSSVDPLIKSQNIPGLKLSDILHATGSQNFKLGNNIEKWIMNFKEFPSDSTSNISKFFVRGSSWNLLINQSTQIINIDIFIRLWHFFKHFYWYYGE